MQLCNKMQLCKKIDSKKWALSESDHNFAGSHIWGETIKLITVNVRNENNNNTDNNYYSNHRQKRQSVDRASFKVTAENVLRPIRCPSQQVCVDNY